jgi:hypothetical protein
MWQGVTYGHETLLPWQFLSVFFLKAEKEERSAVDLQPRLHKTPEKMNESSGSISRANEEEKTEESREQQ